MIDRNREERLQAMRAEGGEDDAHEETEVWGESDEEVCDKFYAHVWWFPVCSGDIG